MSLSFLPPLNAALNALSALLLLAGLAFIRTGRRRPHSVCMVSAIVVSSVFLAGYLTYHIAVGTTHYRGTGWARGVYFSILGTHTVLAVTVPFLVTVTLVRALKERFDQHRRIARVTYPIWLYVSVTGVIIYFMLRSSYPTSAPVTSHPQDVHNAIAADKLRACLP